MGQLFQRQVRVTLIPSKVGDYRVGSDVDAVVVENLRVQFKVKKDLKPQPNPATITITNLAESTRGLLDQKGVRVILEAGYPSTMATIFSGDATHIDHVRDGADWSTKIECGDGARAVQYANVNMAFGDNTKAGTIVKKVVGALGVDPGNLADHLSSLDRNYETGYSVQGRAADELNRQMKQAGLEWSIQGNTLQILKPGQALDDFAVDLTPESGLIGSPEHGTPTERGGPALLKVKSLLLPSARPGGKINIHSAGQHGSFRILSVEDSGDTKGGDFYSDMEVSPL